MNWLNRVQNRSIYMMRKAKGIVNALSIGVMIGFVVGLAISLNHIIANGYAEHRMFRLIALCFQEFLDKYVPLAIISIVPFIILSLIWKLVLSHLIKARMIRHWEKLRTFLACIGCSMFFLYGVWAINRYWLPHKFHPVGLLCDVGILLLTILLGWVLIRLRWRNMTKVLEAKYIGRIAFILIAFIIALNVVIVLDSKINTPEGPSVIMILSDALRQDHLGCYGYKRDTTPNIDSFARSATLFKNAFAQSPSTKPSVASLFTSRYPSQHNAIYNEDCLNPSWITLAEVLREHGYMTAGFIENPMISRKFQYDQGFSTWELDDRRHKEGGNQSMVDFDRKIFSWLDKHYRRPFFLYIHYIDPHSPYGAPEPFRHFFDKDYEGDIRGTKKFLRNKQRFRENKADLEHLIALYDDEIRYIDSRFGGLIRKLEQLNILDDSVILFLSDHGEGFLEHGRFFHSYSVYSELVNVPLIMSHRTSFERDYEEKCVQHIDVFPTITHILKIDTDSLVLEGNSVLSKSDEEVTVISEHLREGWGVPQRCVISGNWKLVHNTDSSIYRLFDIEKDPLDRKNLIRENAEVADDLKSYLSGWQKSLSDKKEAPKVKLDSVTKEKLRSLGYLQ